MNGLGWLALVVLFYGLTAWLTPNSRPAPDTDEVSRG